MAVSNISISGAELRFRNFAGRPDLYNQAGGKKNFCVILDNNLAETLAQDGWNVRWLEPKEEGDLRQAYLQVSLRFDNFPPKIYLINDRGQSLLRDDNVDILDWAEIETTDIIIRPYEWKLHPGTPKEMTGIKAYVKEMYVKIHENEFEKKWLNAPEGAADGIGGCGSCEACDGTCGHDGTGAI